MKNKYLFILALFATTLSSCGPKVVAKELAIKGSLTKTDYLFEDEWDASGLNFEAILEDNSVLPLKAGEYSLSFSPAKPSGYSGSGVNVKITAYGQSRSKNFRDITVANEVYSMADEVEEYYEDFNGLTKTGNSFVVELQKHSFDKHTNWINYDSVQSYYKITNEHRSIDEIQGVYKSEAFYTGKQLALGSGSKEHVWACANSNGSWVHSGSGVHSVDDAKNYYGGGSDLYQIRPCDSQLNTVRGNAIFTELSSGYSSYGDGGPYQMKAKKSGYSGDIEYADFVEPHDEFKGDIARILAYVYMHYSKHSGIKVSSDYVVAKLDFKKVIGLQSSNTTNDAIEMLKRWNELDPVSEIEKYRNHTIQQIQGNRNPFVDHPEWMDRAF